MIRPNQYRLSVCICLLIIAVLLGYVVFFIFFADCLPPLFIHNTERIQVIEADPGTVVELVWVYEADAQSETRDRPDTYQRIRDISFKALSSNDSWSVGENDYLVSDLPLASFELKRPFLTTKAIVYCLKGVNGNAIVSLTSGQNTAYYKLNGNDTEAILLSGLAASEQPFFIMKCVCAGIIALLFLFIAAAVWGMVFHWWTPASLGYVKSKDSIPDEPSKRMPLFQLISAFFIPAAAALTAAIWLGIAPFGERTLIINDSFWENDHFLAFTHDLNFFNGSLQYTFSKALGGDTFSLFTSYMLSPLNWVIKLFPVTAIPIFLTFLSITRIGFCGASFFIFINKTHGLRWSGLIFSTSYALCAYAAAYADSLFFLPPLVYLPLVALGIVKISRGQRPLFFMITLACAVMENYYFGYIFCLFSVIYFIWRTLLTTEFRVLLCRIPVFFAQMAAAAGTAGFILVPSILALSGGPKHLTTFSLTAPLNFSLPDLISKGFPGAFSIAELESGSPMIFCGTLITFLVVEFFLSKLIHRREKLLTGGLLIVLLASFFVQVLNLVWHGFNAPALWPYRYAYLFSFCCIDAAARSWKIFLREQKKTLQITMAVLLIVLAAIWMIQKKYSYLPIRWIGLGCGAALLYGMFFLLHSKCRSQKWKELICVGIGLITIIELTANFIQIWDRGFIENEAKNTAMSFSEWMTYEKKTRYLVDDVQQKDHGLYRMENSTAATENDPIHFGYKGLSHFSSTVDVETLLFLKKIGISQPFYATRYADGLTITGESLLGVKYIIAKFDQMKKPYKKFAEEDNTVVWRNSFALSFGTAAPYDLLTCDIHSDDPFDVQNKMLKCLTNSDSETLTRVQPEHFQTKNLSFSTTDGITTWTKKDAAAEAWLEWDIVVPEDKLLYAYFPVPSRRLAEIFIDGESKGIYFDSRRYGILTLAEQGNSRSVNFKIRLLETDLVLQDTLFYTEDVSRVKTAFSTLNQAVFQDAEGNRISGTINNSKDSPLLLLTIPYDTSWQIRVDGAVVTATRVLNGLTAIPLEPGKNTLEMEYHLSGTRAGICLTMISIILFCLLNRRIGYDFNSALHMVVEIL